MHGVSHGGTGGVEGGGVVERDDAVEGRQEEVS